MFPAASANNKYSHVPGAYPLPCCSPGIRGSTGHPARSPHENAAAEGPPFGGCASRRRWVPPYARSQLLLTEAPALDPLTGAPPGRTMLPGAPGPPLVGIAGMLTQLGAGPEVSFDPDPKV